MLIQYCIYPYVCFSHFSDLHLYHHQISEEGSVVSCVIERFLGTLDYVYINYTVVQIDSTDVASDFDNTTGVVMFLPGQRSEVTA